MFFIIEFLIYLIFIFYLAYSFFDQLFLCTQQGGKIAKYIKKYDFKNIACSFDNAKDNNFFILIKSPEGRKYTIYCTFSTLALLAIKMALTYNSLFSNYYIITIFEKQINLQGVL